MPIKLMYKCIVTAGLTHLMLLLLVGCATNAGPSAGNLLEQNYQSMNNVELTAYEQELSDQISKSSAFGFGGTSIGFGFGSWGSSGGVGIGVDQSLSGGSDPATDLRTRRDAVRTEMRNRGLLPSSSGVVIPAGIGPFFSYMVSPLYAVTLCECE
jgi:hypothetical protein